MKIAIIKLGAKGDVVRTLSILPAIKKKYPEAEICWITKQNSIDLLGGNPYIERVLGVPVKTEEEFDILYSLDPDEEACRLASEIKAKKKLGFYNEGGYAVAFNLGAEYYVNTMFDDELKKNNKRTYQEMIFEAAELKFNGEYCSIYLNEDDKKYSENFLKINGLNGKKIIGVHMGSSPRWPSKVWAESRIKDFIVKVKMRGFEVILFGGPDEVERHDKFANELENEGIKIYRNRTDNTNREFASLVNICDYMVCSDSFALHISLALKKPTIGLFFCTPPNEIEDYGLLKKVVSPMLYEFFPERMNEYSKELTESIKAEEVLSALGI